MYCCRVQVLPRDTNEGELSVIKARLVRNVRLARIATTQPLLLQYRLLLYPATAALWTPTGDVVALGLFSAGPLAIMRGKRFADCMEALIGAMYVAGAAATGAAAGPDALRSVSAFGLTSAATLCAALGVLPDCAWHVQHD